MTAITRSPGVTPTERLLARLCDQSFLRLWSYPNPFKDDGHELCDLLAVFGDRVFVFFDREIALADTPEKDPQVQWQRWKRKVIDAQARTAHGAERYLRSGRKVYLDARREISFPIPMDPKNLVVHKIIVAHGAMEACKKFASANIYGSLAISYGARAPARSGDSPFPFMIEVDKAAPIHVLDSHNLPIVLSELDTIADLSTYLDAKAKAIARYDFLSYCGEEDLLAHYMLNFDSSTNEHFIGTKDTGINGVLIGEGEWKDFVEGDLYRRTKHANRVSYLWDEILQVTCDNALKGKLLGDADLMQGPSAPLEMAKEPRFHRRALSAEMQRVIRNFPDPDGRMHRHVAFMPSFYAGKGYVFLQVGVTPDIRVQTDFRAKRREILRIACGAARNAMPGLEMVVGIGIEAPKFTRESAEDFLLMNCAEWSDDERASYEQENAEWGFFCSPSLRKTHRTVKEFVTLSDRQKRGKKIGRNEPCPCGSGAKYKHCHGRSA